MTEKTSTPEDSIHNLRLVIEALEAEGTFSGDVRLAEDGISQIERMRAALQIVAMMIKVVNSALSPITSTEERPASVWIDGGCEHERGQD
jgi:hypothetical protein